MNNIRLNWDATAAVDYKQLKVSSTAFQYEGMIPVKYTCDGKNFSPPLDIEHIPEEARCLALIVDDPDAPVGTWVHWLVWNIPVTHHLKENEVHGKEGMNDFQQKHYGGPCPPSGTHRYFFKVYALNALLDLPLNTKKPQLEKAMSEHIIAFGELVGLYKRKK
jgi:Raf kinase inhibitor-like YbhB/YbcL family protein